MIGYVIVRELGLVDGPLPGPHFQFVILFKSVKCCTFLGGNYLILLNYFHTLVLTYGVVKQSDDNIPRSNLAMLLCACSSFVNLTRHILACGDNKSS